MSCSTAWCCLLVYFVFRVFEPFLVPLGWAAVFAVIFYSLNKQLEQRWGRTLSASVSTAGVTLILVVPVLLLCHAVCARRN